MNTEFKITICSFGVSVSLFQFLVVDLCNNFGDNQQRHPGLLLHPGMQLPRQHGTAAVPVQQLKQKLVHWMQEGRLQQPPGLQHILDRIRIFGWKSMDGENPQSKQGSRIRTHSRTETRILSGKCV